MRSYFFSFPFYQESRNPGFFSTPKGDDEIRKTGITVFALVCITVSGCSSSECPLPTVEEFHTANITKYYDAELKKDVDFAIEKEDWESIRAELLPAKRDPEHPKRQILAKLSLETLSRYPCRITLFRNGTDSGAFSVSEGYEQQPIFYRGGETPAIEKALKTAYQNSQKKKE